MDEQVRQFAFFDVLTALPNRRLLMDRIGQAMSLAKRSGCYGAMLFLDLDNFKPLNDQQGHDAGDLLLMEVAHRLNNCVRATDTVSRMGGDEFVVLLSSLDTDEARSTEQAGCVAESIRSALAKPYQISVPQDNCSVQIEHHCSASIGVVVFSKACQDRGAILKSADAAMYQAKKLGRNRVQFYTGST